MAGHLLSNMLVHFKFFRRNRLLLAIAIVFLALSSLTVIPAIAFEDSANESFGVLKTAFRALNSFAFVLSPLTGILLISSHLRGRSIKMVVTKPCLPEVWLASALLSVTAISAVAHLGVVSLAVISSSVMGIAFQDGFVFLSISNFIESEVFLFYLVFLSILIHPVLAVITALFFSEASLGAMLMSVAALRESGAGFGVTLLDYALRGIFMALPLQTGSIIKESIEVSRTFNATPSDWLNLSLGGGYMMVFCGFFYMLSSLVLKRKNLT